MSDQKKEGREEIGSCRRIKAQNYENVKDFFSSIGNCNIVTLQELSPFYVIKVKPQGRKPEKSKHLLHIGMRESNSHFKSDRRSHQR